MKTDSNENVSGGGVSQKHTSHNTRVDEKTESAASGRGGLSTHLCKLVRANLTSLGTPTPLLPSRCDALYVGYDDGREYVVALTPRSCMCVRLMLMGPLVYVAQTRRKIG